MTSRFTNLYDEEPEDEVEDTEQPVETGTSSSRFTNLYDDDIPEVLETEADVVSTQSGTSKFTNLYDDDDTEEVTEDAVAPVPTVEETPEQELIRTGVMPVGYKRVVSVPTGNRPEDRIKLVPIDAPTPTVSEQTESAFGFGETAQMADVLYGDDDVDLIGLEDTDDKKGVTKEFIEDNISPAFQGMATAVAGAGNEALKALAITFTAAAETGVNTGVALNKALNEVGIKTGFTDRNAGEKFAGDLGMMLEVVEAAVPGLGGAMSPVRKTFKEAKRLAKAEARAAKDLARINNRKMRISVAKNATNENIAAKTANAETVAAQNADLKEQLILGFEDQTGKTISTVVDGVRVIDDDLARIAGKETAEEISFRDTRSQTAKALGLGEVEAEDAAQLVGLDDTITAPILKPEKLDGLVAAAAELKENFPTAFDNDKTIIDNLLNLTVDKDLMVSGDVLIDTLNKYNVSFEDYILTVVGSGSEAGKVLNKLSQIKRARPLNEMQQLQRAATEAQQGQIRNNIMRIEGIRRGGLVSQLATASRNVTSAGIRAPLDSLANVMDTALYNMGQAEGVGGKVAAGTKALVSKENWTDSFANMKYMFGPESRLDAKEYVDFILDRPELAKQFDMMFNQLNELQANTGRGVPRQKQIDEYMKLAKDEARKNKTKFDKRAARQAAEEYASGNFDTLGKGADTILSELEDGVSVLNSANRWQEYLIRRGAFLGELERLTKREYGIDLIDTLNEGKIKDLLNDASSVRPKDARSFTDLVADATNTALDVTYAKQPETAVFREATSFITRNGLTVVMPFPRFMFNSMEIMGNYAGGASIPLTKKLFLKEYPKGTQLTRMDRQRISRNLVGIAAVGAAYMARTDEDAPADYKQLNVGDGTVMDTTPQFPLRQMLYLGEATKNITEGTFYDKFDVKEFAETFMGTNLRTGVGNSIVEEVIALGGGSDLTSDEAAARRVGRALGNYLTTWMVPFAQIIDGQRAVGERGEVYKDVAQDPTLKFSTTLGREIARPFAARGFTLSPEEEAALPTRESLFQEDKSRVNSGLKVLLGLSMTTKDSEEGEYLKSLGFTDYKLGSKSKVPSIRRFENENLREIIPAIVSVAQALEDDARDTYQSGSETLQDTMSEQAFVNSRIKPLIEKQIAAAKKNLTDGNTVNSEAPEYLDAMRAYRKLSPSIRKAAASEFLLQEDRVPDGSNAEDLARLAVYGKALSDAYK